ncbi:hypothetical protein C0993_006044, partial [Termitomyces sp. T159_Od127]
MSRMPVAPAQYTYNDSLPPAPLRSYFFLLTIPLVAASWVISLVSQSIVTARIGNSFVGPLWFALILQFLTLLILFYGLLTDTLPAFHTTLNTFTTLVIVFAVLGVDRNIFNPIIPAQKALSAGWLILAVLNSLWVIYFTTAPAHPAAYTLPPLGLRLVPNRRAPPKDPVDHPDQARSIPSLQTNIDTFPSPHVLRSSGTATISDSRPASHPQSPTPTQTQTQTHARTGSQPASLVTADSQTQARVSGSAWASACARTDSASPTHQTTQSIRSSLHTTNTYTNATREPGPSSPSSSVDPAGGAGGTGADADADDGGTGALGLPVPLPLPLPLPQQKEYPWRAKALYQYKKSGDPNELAFAKDEILEISDKSGKWWEGRKADGTVGS